MARLLDSADPEVRSAAEAARDRIAAPARWPTVSAHVAALIADVLTEARNEGRLIYRVDTASRCRYCGTHSEWKKLPRKRREREIMIRCVDFACRVLIIQGHISVGACLECVEQALPYLRAELSTFPVQLPMQLRTEGAPVYRRWDRCRCKRCGWSGHEGQLGRLMTLMNDGDYPGKCPSCGAERTLWGPDPFERLVGFDVELEALPQERNG